MVCNNGGTTKPEVQSMCAERTCFRRPVGPIRQLLVLAAVAAMLSTGCVFREVKQQQARIDAQCQIQGTVASERG